MWFFLKLTSIHWKTLEAFWLNFTYIEHHLATGKVSDFFWNHLVVCFSRREDSAVDADQNRRRWPVCLCRKECSWWRKKTLWTFSIRYLYKLQYLKRDRIGLNAFWNQSYNLSTAWSHIYVFFGSLDTLLRRIQCYNDLKIIIWVKMDKISYLVCSQLFNNMLRLSDNLFNMSACLE